MLYSDPQRAAYERWRRGAPPRLVVIEGRRDQGNRARLRRLVDDPGDVAWIRPNPSGGGLARESVARSIRREHPDGVSTRGATGPVWPPDWSAVWALWVEAVENTPSRMWVIDDAHLLPAAGWDGLLEAWARIRGQALPVHLVLFGEPGVADRMSDVPHDLLRLDPLPSATWLSRDVPWSSDDQIAAAAVFGRSTAFHEAVDPGHSVATNVRELLLRPGAPLLTRTLDSVGTHLQRPERYLRAISALAAGRREWGEVREAVGDLSSSGQLGPYMKTLEDLGLVVGERSLDAHPRTRRRRWRLTDPHTAFWFDAILPLWDRLGVQDGADLWLDVAPGVDAHVHRVLPILVREWLGTARAAALLGSPSREAGGLWGEGYDIDVASTLRSGAIVYVWTRWLGDSFTPAEVEACLGQIRHTRYGFGRERRLKLFVQRRPPDHALARVDARDPEVVVIGADSLVGPAGFTPR